MIATGQAYANSFFQLGYVGLCAGDCLLMDVVAAGVAQSIELQVEHLLAGVNAGVAEFLCGKKGGWLVPEKGSCPWPACAAWDRRGRIL